MSGGNAARKKDDGEAMLAGDGRVTYCYGENQSLTDAGKAQRNKR